MSFDLATLLSLLPGWPFRLDNSFWVALLLVVAPLAGEAVFRYLRWPRIVGYTLVGLFASAASFDTSGLRLSGVFHRAMEVALAVLLFELGSRINPRWLLANPWLVATSLAEAGLTFVAVYAVGASLGLGVGSSVAVATVCMVSSPAVIMRVTAELNARGQVTERLLLLSALSTVYAVVTIHILLGVLQGMKTGDPWDAAQLPLATFATSFVLALVLAFAVGLAQRKLDLRDENGALLLLGLLFLTLALVHLLGASPLLVPLLAGIVLRTRDARPRLWPRHFGTAGGALVVLLFVVNGMAVDWRLIAAGGVAALVLLVLRAGAKIGAAVLLGRRSGLSLRQSAALGVALLPMSGVAFLLTASLHAAFPEFGTRVASALAGAITVMEIVGPLLTQWALKACREATFNGTGGQHA
ncbi:MAG: cation:proton antiporter [Azonexus sp.]|jgi:Kef-type K+ transport system membrane component KefB|nr:cation:proton antiporter [Betaproteobacteria bacterium]MBK8917970.1 cation:proton antiporter [Betaproteobacteria bacterium]MBP6036400.1 cation:proton antiporter [Azonexus sp.]MBP6907009.1 cation:proton antiporter [Azonexus sp.]